MPPVLNAEVFTRRTVTVHEDFDTQVDRFTPDLWREYAEKRPVSIKFHLDHIAVSDPNDDYREYAEKRPVSTEFHLDHIAVSDPNDDYQVAVRRWRNALVHSTVFPKWTRPAEIFTVHEEPAEFAREIRLFRDCLHHAWKNVFLAIMTRATNETSTPISLFRATHHGMQQRLGQERVTDATTWTDEKNRRRCELVDKEIAGNISPTEQVELRQLQVEMLAYRRKVAPLPLEGLRALHQELLRKAGDKTE